VVGRGFRAEPVEHRPLDHPSNDLKLQNRSVPYVSQSLDERAAEVLWLWRRETPYPEDKDWVFASPHLRGKWTYWPGTLYRAHLRPAAEAAGITAHIGWHTFHRTYATLLKANGEDAKAVQELIHANYWVTMNLYAQAITQNKRDAQSRVVNMLLGAKKRPKARFQNFIGTYWNIATFAWGCK
jgi:hypothetical protein